MTTWTTWCESSSGMDRIPGNWWRDAIRISMTGDGFTARSSWEVDPDTGALGNSLENNSWFDAAGNLVKSLEAGSRQFTKTTFDSLNRATHVYRRLWGRRYL
jgi:arabinogalactan endo-1,4-beta-galactosidase